jgi:hypothetical protein
MARLLWALTCQRVITDRDTNLVSYIDGFEQFGVPKLPFPFPPFYVATLWERESPRDSLAMRIRVLAPNKTALQTFEPKGTLKFPVPRHRMNVLLGGHMVEQDGRFKIVVEQKKGNRWRKEKTLQIDVNLVRRNSE